MADTLVRGRDFQRPVRASFSWHRQPHSGPPGGIVCKYWLSGNCRRNPCRFLHSETAAPIGYAKPMPHSINKESHNSQRQSKVVHKEEIKESRQLQRMPKTCNENAVEEYNHSRGKNNVSPQSISVTPSEGGGTKKPQHKICKYWITENCVHGEKCNFLHSWSYGNELSMLTQLEGHKKAVTGITLPYGSDKLFSGSKDGIVRGWNCHTGECVGEVDMGEPIGCLISEGQLLFVGITNAVKAFNIQTNASLTLNAPGGQVYAMVEANGMLLAGVHDGSILVWSFNSDSSSFKEIASLKGHTGAVISLVSGGGRVYSGSMDSIIRVWDMENDMKCIHTLNKHSEVVMSVICWDLYLLSCSLDQTLKVWAATEAGEIEVTYTHNEEHGILALAGMFDADGKPILLCSCNDNSVRLYDLPSFNERGRVFVRQEARTIHSGPNGLFFTGDATGRVSVWRLSGNYPSPEA